MKEGEERKQTQGKIRVEEGKISFMESCRRTV
jgi:hypothetical protein